MVTSRMSYNLHCDIGRPLESLGDTHAFGTHDIDVPTLYVAVATWVPKCNMYNVDSDVSEKNNKIEEITDTIIVEDIPKEDKVPVEKSITNNVENQPEKLGSDNEDAKLKKTDDLKSPEKEEILITHEDVKMVSPTPSKDDDKMEEDQASIMNSSFNDTLPDSERDDNNDSPVIVSESNDTPQKNPQEGKKLRTSSHKKIAEQRLRIKEERERKRLEEKEAKEKQRLEKLEQKIKEKREKEEQRKKEKIEKEEQKRKEREEKEAQKVKEREEKELQKIKEREEKEAQKIKEREEKEAQKIKEKEEKEEQKRKEREEKELKKQQELEKDKQKIKKESAAFVNFFVPRKSTGSIEPKKQEETVSNFMPFQVKIDMRLAPSTRCTLTKDQKSQLLLKISKQEDNILYLKEIKTKTLGRSSKTWPVDDTDEIIVVEDTGIGECVEEQPIKNIKMKAKFLQFHENKRPAYFGTWRKKSKHVKPRNPLGVDKDNFDYEVDSDDDWEEEEPGESLHGSDDEAEKEIEADEYEVDNDFFVPHGYLSDEEAENEETMELTPETQKEKLKILQIEFEEEMKSKTERIKPRLIGCIWETKLKPKIQDAISSFLEERMMIINAPIIIKKRELNKENANTGSKTSTPTRKILNKELIPDFLRMIHGSTNNKIFLVNEFINYLSNQQQHVNVSKAGLISQLKELATWKKCPDEGIMFNKNCWYVNEDIRKQYNVNLILPNKWSFSEESNAKKKLSL